MNLQKTSLSLFVLPALCGCSAVMVGGGAGYDAGTLGVSGIKTGVGGHVEVIGYGRARSLGVGPALQLAGYNTAGDADPLAFTTFDVRYRRPARGGDTTQVYWEIGSGLGAAWSAGIRAAAMPLQGEVGVQRQTGSVILSLGVRERFLGLVGAGSPAWDAFNSVQLVFSARFGPKLAP